MPFALLIVGALLLIAGARNKQSDLFVLVRGDFTGPNNFIFWMVAILIIGAVGYIPKLKPLSTAFMSLVIIVLFLMKGKGFFPQFFSAISSTQSTSASAPAPAASTQSGQAGQLSALPILPSLQTLITNAGGIF